MSMRTHIDIDDKPLADAMKTSGASAKREVVELGLASLVALKKQERVKKYRGKLGWEGDLNRMRSKNRSPMVIFNRCDTDTPVTECQPVSTCVFLKTLKADHLAAVTAGEESLSFALRTPNGAVIVD